MYKRQTSNSKGAKYSFSLQDSSKLKRVKKHPIQQVISTLPQLVISFAILFFAGTQFQSGISNVGGITFYTSLLASFVVCSVFVLLQLQGAEYKNWQQDATTRQYIQIASISSIISFFGLNYALWSVFGIMTPVMIACGFVFALSLLIIVAAFV